MRNIIVGTAGHVDHGKTCLIKALTGVNTDRLKEEQKRGITIELGFAQLEHEKGLRIGIIDVPGHEQFVKNMLAGIGGIDLVLLVVAADEGIMPQTREHFSILKLLRIQKGIVVITKSDLVDAEWMELVKEDIGEMVAGTFLDGAPVMDVSSYTGQNIEKLKDLIVEMSGDGLTGKNQEVPFRLPVDRVFSMSGFGTVATGTLMEGICRVGDELQLYPTETTVKIRGLQTHGEATEEATAGQRTAINLVNIKKEDIERGMVLAEKGSMYCTRALDVTLEILEESPRVLKNRSKVHVSIGSAEKIAKVVLANQEELEPGETGYAQLRFMEELAVKRGDRFIIRFYSPVETIGGGQVLDGCPAARRRKGGEFLKACARKSMELPEEAAVQMILEAGPEFMTRKELELRMNQTSFVLAGLLKRVLEEKRIIEIGKDTYMHRDFADSAVKMSDAILMEFHKANPILPGIGKEEMRSRLSAALHLTEGAADSICRYLVRESHMKESNNLFSAQGHQVQYSDAQKVLKQELEDKFLADAFGMLSLEEIMNSYKNKKLVKQMVEELAGEGMLVKLKYPYYIHHSCWDKALKALQEYKEKQEEIVLGEFRDRLMVSRKYAVTILENFDDKKLTRKNGDSRICL